MRLTPRLQMIADRIEACCMADIGTDHAFLPIYLLEQRRIQRAIASDIRPGPLAIAKKHVDASGFSDSVSLRLGGGLSTIAPGEAEAIVIAGMGGKEIMDILSEAKAWLTTEQLFLQPMNAQPELRKWLLENEFDITGESLSIEGHRVYNLILAQKGTSQLCFSELDYHVPYYLKSHPHFPAFKKKMHTKFSKVRNGLRAAEQPDYEQLAVYEGLLSALERM